MAVDHHASLDFYGFSAIIRPMVEDTCEMIVKDTISSSELRGRVDELVADMQNDGLTVADGHTLNSYKEFTDIICDDWCCNDDENGEEVRTTVCNLFQLALTKVYVGCSDLEYFSLQKEMEPLISQFHLWINSASRSEKEMSNKSDEILKTLKQHGLKIRGIHKLQTYKDFTLTFCFNVCHFLYDRKQDKMVCGFFQEVLTDLYYYDIALKKRFGKTPVHPRHRQG